MSWGSAAEFFAMGGYGLFVWGSYAVTATIVVAELALLARRRRTCLHRISRRVTSEKSAS